MVNYLYSQDSIAANSEAYEREGEIAVGKGLNL